MAGGVLRQTLGADGDAILWLWEAHNSVSARLRVEGGGDPLYPKHLFPSMGRCPYCYLTVGAAEPASHDTVGVSPHFNNTMFLVGESLLVREEVRAGKPRPTLPRSVVRNRQLKAVERGYVWNRTAVLLYLWNFYHLDRTHGSETGVESESDHDRVSQATVLHAAWPRRRLVRDRSGMEWRQRGWPGRTAEADQICLEPFVLGGVFLALLAFWLYRKRTCRRLWR